MPLIHWTLCLWFQYINGTVKFYQSSRCTIQNSKKKNEKKKNQFRLFALNWRVSFRFSLCSSLEWTQVNFSPFYNRSLHTSPTVWICLTSVAQLFVSILRSEVYSVWLKKWKFAYTSVVCKSKWKLWNWTKNRTIVFNFLCLSHFIQFYWAGRAAWIIDSAKIQIVIARSKCISIHLSFAFAFDLCPQFTTILPSRRFSFYFVYYLKIIFLVVVFFFLSLVFFCLLFASM